MSINFNNNVISIKLKTDNFNFSKRSPELDKRTQLIKENITNLMGMLNRILQNDKINEISYEKIYTLAYKICNEKANKELYDNLHDILHKYLIKIYNEIDKYFLEFEEISEFVNKMIETYKDFSYRVNVIKKTLLYYEKNFLQKQYTTYEQNLNLLADKIFFDIFVNEKTQKKIIDFIINVLNKARENEYFDKMLLRSLVGFFIEIKPKENAYRLMLEPYIIISSMQYYEKNYYEKYFLNNNYSVDGKNNPLIFISKYIKKLYRILLDEELRFIDFNLIISRNDILESIIETLLIKVIEKEDLFFKFLIAIINDPDKEIIAILRNCLDFPLTLSHSINKKEDNITNQNTLYLRKIEINDKKQKIIINKESSKIKKIKDMLYSKFASALETVGENLLNLEKISFLEKKSNSSNNINVQIESIISIVENLMKLIENIEVFKQEANIFNDKEYSQSIKVKLSMIVNNKFSYNKKDEKEYQLNSLLFNISKNLPLHIDYTLKNFPHKFNYDYVLNYFERIILIFRLLDDKDIFEINNRKFLSQRILSQIYNEDLELKLINRLKLENGTIFTFRSEIMINDIKNSINVFDNYRTSKYYHKLTKDFDVFRNVDINFKILTQGSWLINQEENINWKELIIISDLHKKFRFLKISEKFEEFYKTFFPCKLLNYNLSNSTYELYSKINGKHYNFTVCSLQAFILLCFNYQKGNLNFNDLNQNININLKANSDLVSLVKLYSYFYKISKTVFLNSLIPLIKLGLVKLILIKENSAKDPITDVRKSDKLINNFNNSNDNITIKYSLMSLNNRDSKISLFELLSFFFETDRNKRLLEETAEANLNRKNYNNSITNKERFSFNYLHKESILINNISEFSKLNIDDLALEINLNFNSKQQKLRISYLREKEKKNIANDSVESKEIEDECESLKIERKYQIESNIIRILKCKKIITHQELVNETLSALANYFVPNIAMIKIRLENLIERGFISRVKNDYNKYIYEM